LSLALRLVACCLLTFQIPPEIGFVNCTAFAVLAEGNSGTIQFFETKCIIYENDVILRKANRIYNRKREKTRREVP
jgi:hypothetical protein